jgi:glucose/mannose-6-phosphate isomerase
MEIRSIILKFPEQLNEGALAAQKLKISGNLDNIVVCGMGGSAWPAEILRDWIFPAIPFHVSKTYSLPPQTNKKSLVIICSYSGNTEEPLNCYSEAKRRGFKVVGLTCGGELEILCKKDDMPLVLIPNKVPAPRLGCGYTFAALVKILCNTGLIKNADKELAEVSKKINPQKSEEIGKALVNKIAGKIPVIYSTDRLKTLSYIWKIKLNETSKVPAFCNYFPEMNHNELSGYNWENGNLVALILKDKDEIRQIQKRISLTAEMIAGKNTPVEIVDLEGKSLLEKIINSIILADWVSYHLALKNNIDPFAIKMQEDIKKELKK